MAKGGVIGGSSQQFCTIFHRLPKGAIEGDLVARGHANRHARHGDHTWAVAGLKIAGEVHIVRKFGKEIPHGHSFAERL